MIIRESKDAFIMIEQHHHASISGYLFNQLKADYVPNEYKSMAYAINNHDRGWIPFDKVPLWNDAKNLPFSFIDFPTPLKTVLYNSTFAG